MSASKNLGRGLSALFGDLGIDGEGNESLQPHLISIEQIKAGRMQPRQSFDPEKMSDLIASVRSKGVLQPILLRSISDGNYEIIAGERRWRAAKEAGLTTIPALVVACSDEEALQMGLVENLQRHDLSPLEEAESLKKLIEAYGKTQEQVAYALGKSRSYVANILRLNQLPDSVKNLLHDGTLSAGHARALINTENVEQLAHEIVSQKLSVRDTENLVKKSRSGQNKGAESSSKNGFMGGWQSEDPLLADAQLIAAKIGQALGVQAKLVIKNNTGILSLHFHNLEQLDDLVGILGRSGFA